MHESPVACLNLLTRASRRLTLLLQFFMFCSSRLDTYIAKYVFSSDHHLRADFQSTLQARL